MARAVHVRPQQQREESSLLAVLERLDEGALATFLAARPDLAAPPPRSLVELAARAAAPASVTACREGLDLACHQVHAALCLLPTPATLGQLSGLFLVDEDDPDLAAAVHRLADRLIVVHDGERVGLLPGMDIRHPAGLGPPVAAALSPQSAAALTTCAQRLGVAPAATKTATKTATLAAIAGALSEPGRLARLLATAPAGAADLARRLAYDGPEGHAAGAVYHGDKTSAGWLANRGIVAPVGWDTVLLVREAGVALRGGVVFPRLSLRRPVPAVRPVDAAGADRAAAERALRLVADVATILDGWATDPPRQLKAGGLGIQAVRRTAKAVDRSEVETARVIELAAAAGLVSIDAASDAALPLPAYDEWSALSVAGRWSHLVASWMRWDLHVSLAGALDTKRKPIPPLMVRAPEPEAAVRRAQILAALAELPPATSVASDAMFDGAVWDAPARWAGGPAAPEGLVAWALGECELFGVCGLGGLSTWGRLAVGGDLAGAEAALAATVPAATSDFVVQADLTALAPAELVRPVLAELESMADLESRGAATVYRFTEASVRRGFEAGRSASDVLAFLEAHAAKGVPQALTYLVNDVGRRFGRLRVVATACCLRSDDPSLLAEVVASRPARKLGLRLLAPTVATATAEAATVLTALRDAGYLPAEEGADGSLVLSRPVPRRAVPDRRLAALAGRRPGASAGFGPGSAAAIAARLVRSRADHPPRRKDGPPLPPQSTPTAPAPAPASAGVPPAPVSLFDAGPAGLRPVGIARGPIAVADLLDQAMVDDWPVRLAY
ncbi:MAG: hypothetical protein QOI56_551, partial [Actinomycetota bacterium]|nr:hypothetical protein [Actinomycetota bacterium]